MLIRNLLTGSTPGILHRNGNPPEWQDRWQTIVAAFFEEVQEPCAPTPELTIITWNNRPTKSLLEQCLDRWRVPCLTLGNDLPEWRNDAKPYLLATALDRVSSEHVLGLDSDDVLVVSGLPRILADFRACACDILFSAERTSTPDVPSLTDFERSIAESPFCHLNAGAWMGKTEICRRFFRDCLREDKGDIIAAFPTRRFFKSDQGMTRKTFRRYHPAARLDYHCRVFQSLFGIPPDGEVVITVDRENATVAR
jgi:hypothetical protein